MDRSRLVGLVSTLAFVITAMAATPAYAVELPEFTLKTNGKTTGGAVTINNHLGVVYTCTSWAGTTTSTGGAGGNYSLTFSECTATILTVKMACRSLGDAYDNENAPKHGTILSSGQYFLVPGGAQTPPVSMLLLGNQLHIECTNETKTIAHLLAERGWVLATFSPRNAKTKEFKLAFKGKEGKQELTEWENDKGEVTKIGLESSLDGGSFEADDEIAEVTLSTEKETEVIH